MKYFLILLLLSPLTAIANDQYSKQHCDALKTEKERIQERFTKRYGVAEGNRLNERDRELFMLISKHCRSPIDNRPSYSNSQPIYDEYRSSSSSSSMAINDNWSAQNRVYQGEKLKAWETFYKMPARCRQKSPQHDDFVFCADDKAQQKKAFEQYWKNRIKLK